MLIGTEILVGSLLPFVVDGLPAKKVLAAIIAGVLFVLAGIVFNGTAGIARERDEASAKAFAQPTFLPGEDPKPAGKVWKRVSQLSDEFNGTSLDTSKWQGEPVGNGWRWYGRPPGLFRSENVQIKDGQMCITVSKLDSPIHRGGATFTHQGAIVRSLHPEQPGWYFECRMKANATAMSSTFWLNTKPGSKKRLELDIQECVGRVADDAATWASGWDQIFHSNLIDWNHPMKVQLQRSVPTEVKNHARYFVYAAWWKSPEEVRFYLDGKHVYTIHPKVAWDQPAFIQMAVETYDWNPIPDDGGLVDSGTWRQRTTQYDWVRTWQLVDQPHVESSRSVRSTKRPNIVRAARDSIRPSPIPRSVRPTSTR